MLSELQRVGALIPLASVDTYHGRVATGGSDEVWHVDPEFRNGSNDSGNNNLHNTAALYTSSAEVAKEFGSARGASIFRSRLIEILREEVKGVNPQTWRRSQLDKELANGQELVESLSEKNKKSYLDVEGEPYFSYQKAYGDGDETYGIRANQDERDLFVAKHLHGKLPTAKGDPFDDGESTRALCQKEKALTEDERNEYFEQLTAD